MSIEIPLLGLFEAERIDELCEALEPFERARQLSVRLDLSRLTGLTASTFAVLISTLRNARSKGLCDPLTDYIPPQEPSLLPWLDRGCLDRLLGIATDDGGSVFSGSCGCGSFDDRDGLERVIVSVVLSLSEQLLPPLPSLHTIGTMLWDLGQNVLQHADSHCGVVAMRVDSSTGHVEFAIADRGIGVRRSLAKNRDFENLDDLAALRAAMGPGVTSEPGTGRGMGLYLTRLLLAENQGAFTVRSGHACLAGPELTDGSADLPHFQGTLATVVARIDRELNWEAISRLLERPTGVVSGATI